MHLGCSLLVVSGFVFCRWSMFVAFSCVGVMFLVVFRHGVRHIGGCAPVVTYPHLTSLLQLPLLNFDVVAVGSPV